MVGTVLALSSPQGFPSGPVAGLPDPRASDTVTFGEHFIAPVAGTARAAAAGPTDAAMAASADALSSSGFLRLGGLSEVHAAASRFGCSVKDPPNP